MHEIKIGDKTIGLKATPLTLLYYKQEFKTDLVGDMLKTKGFMDKPETFDSIIFLQMAWAMNKTYEGVGNKFASFETWLSQLESFDITDMETVQAIADEAADGFFRTANKPKGQKDK